MAEMNPEIRGSRRVEKKRLEWTVLPGAVILVEDQKSEDKPDWYRVKVPQGHEISVIKGKIRNLKGTPAKKVGLGLISEIKNGSFDFEGTYVMPGNRIRIPFSQRGIVVGIKNPQ